MARRRPGSGGDPSLRTNQPVGRGPNKGQRKGIALLRHDFAGSRMTVGQFDEPKSGRREDYQILRQAIEIYGSSRRDGGGFERNICLPHGIAGMADRLAKTKPIGQLAAVLCCYRAIRTADASRARVGPVVNSNDPIEVAQYWPSEGLKVVAKGGRLSRL